MGELVLGCRFKPDSHYQRSDVYMDLARSGGDAGAGGGDQASPSCFTKRTELSS
jgi:hypothetical protein